MLAAAEHAGNSAPRWRPVRQWISRPIGGRIVEASLVICPLSFANPIGGPQPMSGHVLQRTRDKGQGTSAKVGTAFEGRLLRILHAVLRNAPPDQAQPLVFDRVARPVTLSRTCVELVA